MRLVQLPRGAFASTYCAAACLCANACEKSCCQQNQAYALQLGTTCGYVCSSGTPSGSGSSPVPAPTPPPTKRYFDDPDEALSYMESEVTWEGYTSLERQTWEEQIQTGQRSTINICGGASSMLFYGVGIELSQAWPSGTTSYIDGWDYCSKGESDPYWFQGVRVVGPSCYMAQTHVGSAINSFIMLKYQVACNYNVIRDGRLLLQDQDDGFEYEANSTTRHQIVPNMTIERNGYDNITFTFLNDTVYIKPKNTVYYANVYYYLYTTMAPTPVDYWGGANVLRARMGVFVFVWVVYAISGVE